MRGKYKFSTIMMGVVIVTLSVFFALIMVIISYATKSAYQLEKNAIYEEVVRYEKLQLEAEVGEIIEYIKLSESKAAEKMRSELLRRVNEAYAIAEQIHNDNIGTLDQSQIEQKIVNALRNKRFGTDKGYIFMDRFDGTVMLYPVRSELEGENVIDLKDDYGNFVIRDEINIARNYNSGYAEGHWIKPNQVNGESGTLKVSYIRRFENSDFYLGTGIYEDQYISGVKEEVLQDLGQFKKLNSKAYNYYVSDIDGSLLFKNGKISDSVQQIGGAELIVANNVPGGDFVQEQVVADGEETVSLTYIKKFENWGWIIGAESSFTEHVSESKAYYLDNVIKSVNRLSAVVALGMLLIIVTGISFLNQKMGQCFRRLENVVLTGVQKDVQGKFCFREFEALIEKVQSKKNAQVQSALIMDDQQYDKKSVGTIVEGEAVTTGLIQNLNTIIQNDQIDNMTAYKLKDVGQGLTSVRKLLMKLSYDDETSETSESTLNFEDFYLKEHVIDTMDLILNEYSDQDIEARVLCDKDLLVYTDPLVISSILTHLTTNAIHHGFSDVDKGELTIEIIYDDDHLRIYFSDNGSGMPNHIQERVFEPYFTTTAMKGDSGLGLADVYNLVNNKLEGAINCSSRVNYGTDFSIDIPGAGPGLWLSIDKTS